MSHDLETGTPGLISVRLGFFRLPRGPISNLDNLGASVDPAHLGAFVESHAQLQVEVCRKEAGDRGGVPVDLDGRVQVLEEFRLPVDFDPTTVPVFNTNTMWARVDALTEVRVPWSWFVVEKQVDGR